MIELLKAATSNHSSKEFEFEDTVILTYLFYCFSASNRDLTCFKKLGTDQGSAQTRELRTHFTSRMRALYSDFKNAALTWAKLNSSTGLGFVNPVWDGITPPSIVSLPHLAAQDILERVIPIHSRLTILSILR